MSWSFSPFRTLTRRTRDSKSLPSMAMHTGLVNDVNPCRTSHKRLVSFVAAPETVKVSKVEPNCGHKLARKHRKWANISICTLDFAVVNIHTKGVLFGFTFELFSMWPCWFDLYQ